MTPTGCNMSESIRPLIRIQPAGAERERWARLAEREGFSYELIELYQPPLLCGTDKAQRRCADWYINSGRVHSVHGAFIGVDPASGDDSIRAISQLRCFDSCGLAQKLGAKQVIFHVSCCTFLRGAYLENWANVCADFYTRLADSFPGLTLCIENSQDVDTTPLEALMQRTDERVQVCLDLGHAHYSGTPIEEWFERLGDSLACLHLSDNNGRFDDHLPLGEGTICWKEADSLYRALGRTLPLTLEVGGLEGVKRSVSYLRENSYFGMGAD